MRYILIIMLGLSLPAVALESSLSKDTSDQAKVLQQKIQKSVPKGCDPEKTLHLPPFN